MVRDSSAHSLDQITESSVPMLQLSFINTDIKRREVDSKKESENGGQLNAYMASD